LRIPLWVVNILSVGIVFVVLIYSEIADNITLLNAFNTGDFNNVIVYVVYNYLSVITLFCGIIFIPAIAMRAKWDKTLRRHFVWFAVFAVMFFVLLVGSSPPPPIGPILVLGMGYTLYESAKSLVPLNRIPLQEFAPESKPK